MRIIDKLNLLPRWAIMLCRLLFEIIMGTCIIVTWICIVIKIAKVLRIG